jgi:hypothetical protein
VRDWSVEGGKLDTNVRVGGQRGRCGVKRNSCRFLPTVTIGDEKCVIEREEQKLDATVTVGEQRGGAESSEISADRDDRRRKVRYRA